MPILKSLNYKWKLLLQATHQRIQWSLLLYQGYFVEWNLFISDAILCPLHNSLWQVGDIVYFKISPTLSKLKICKKNFACKHFSQKSANYGLMNKLALFWPENNSNTNKCLFVLGTSYMGDTPFGNSLYR